MDYECITRRHGTLVVTTEQLDGMWFAQCLSRSGKVFAEGVSSDEMTAVAECRNEAIAKLDAKGDVSGLWVRLA